MSYASKSVETASSWRGFSSLCLFIFFFICVLITCICTFSYSSKKEEVSTNTALETGKPYLVNVTNIPDSAEKCTEGKTYGFNATGGFYTDKGCSGIFVYSPSGETKRLGVCTTNTTDFKSCTSDRMVKDHYPRPIKKLGTYEDALYTLPSIDDIPSYNSLTGFLDMTNENIAILQQNGKCTTGNYGFHGNNMISVKNGCKGLFVFGPLIGKCDADNNVTEKMCPIGLLDKNGQGLTLNEIKPFDTSTICNQGNKYGFQNVNMGFKDPTACQTDGLMFGPYNIKCEDNTGQCDLNRNEIITLT